MHSCAALASLPALSHSPLGVTVRYEEERYNVSEEAGYVTLALVLSGDTEIPVTVSVNTLDLQNNSVGDAATGKLFKLPFAEHFTDIAECSMQLAMWSGIIDPCQRDKEHNFH